MALMTIFVAAGLTGPSVVIARRRQAMIKLVDILAVCAAGQDACTLGARRQRVGDNSAS